MADDETTYEATSLAKPPPRRAYLALLQGSRAAAIALRPDEPVTVGRSRGCTVTIDDGSVSRQQATLTWDGDRTVWLEDHGSKNGTFLSGTRIERRVAVPHGATIRIGPAELTLFLPRDAAEGATAGPSRGRGFVAEDPAMLAVAELLARAAQKNTTILLTGETGSGKEVMARWVHEASPRAGGPFVAVNCGSLPESLAESTLFGHERGAFTGAIGRQLGVFEQAHRGTLFLDEVGELSATSQTRLLRVIEDHRVQRLGAQTSVPVDVRVVAATHRDLARDVASGRFREDLYYRLDVVRVRVPSLRERRDDVLPLARFFLASFAPGGELGFSPEAEAALLRCAWPGNVRQLRNVVQRGAALATSAHITGADLGLDTPVAASVAAPDAPELRRRVDESEQAAILAALAACDGNQTHAARRLGIARRTLIYKLEKYGLKPSPGGSSR